MRIAQEKPVEDWDPEILASLLSEIEKAATNELDESNKALAAAACIPICDWFLQVEDNRQLELPRGGRKRISDIKTDMETKLNEIGSEHITDIGQRELEALQRWKNGLPAENGEQDTHLTYVPRVVMDISRGF
jgi:hypothetical protein